MSLALVRPDLRGGLQSGAFAAWHVGEELTLTYFGPTGRRHLKTNLHSFHSILCTIESQRSRSRITSEMWSYLLRHERPRSRPTEEGACVSHAWDWRRCCSSPRGCKLMRGPLFWMRQSLVHFPSIWADAIGRNIYLETSWRSFLGKRQLLVLWRQLTGWWFIYKAAWHSFDKFFSVGKKTLLINLRKKQFLSSYDSVKISYGNDNAQSVIRLEAATGLLKGTYRDTSVSDEADSQPRPITLISPW